MSGTLALLVLGLVPQLGDPSAADALGERARATVKTETQEPESDRRRGSRGDGEPGQRMSPAEAKRWWEGLSEKEKQQARERWSRYREMRPEAQKELERRAEQLRSVGREVLTAMSEEERKAFQSLAPPEQERRLRDLVRRELEARGEKVEAPVGPPPHGPLEERLCRSREEREKWAAKRRERDLSRAVEDGWIAEKAAEQLRKLPAEQQERALERVRQLQMIQWFDQHEMWAKMEVDAEERARLVALEPRPFFEEVRKRSEPLRRDRDPRRHGRGDRDGRGERGGRERPPHGPPPPPGPGQGPPPGEGPEKPDKPEQADGDGDGERRRPRWHH